MQILANGLISGLTTAVLAVAFSVVYVPTRIFYIALGGVFAAAPFVTWVILQSTGSIWLGAGMGLGASILLSIGCEVLNHGPLKRREASTGAHLIASLGMYIALVQIIALIWGNETKSLRAGIDITASMGSVTLQSSQIIGASVSICLLLGFFTWLKFSRMGLRFRALSDNPKELSLLGFNIKRLRLLAFGISGFLAGASSLVTAYDVGFDPHAGLPALLLAVVAAIIGGRLSFIGAVVGALLLEIARAEVAWFLSARWQEAVTFLILALFLYLRPQGLVGRSMRLETDV